MAKRGAPVGNQNGVKHGLYSKAMTESENQWIEEAEVSGGLEDEIALLRVKLLNLLENHPDRIDLQLQAIGTIIRLVRTQHIITPPSKEKLNAEIGNVLTEVATSLGLEVVN